MPDAILALHCCRNEIKLADAERAGDDEESAQNIPANNGFDTNHLLISAMDDSENV